MGSPFTTFLSKEQLNYHCLVNHLFHVENGTISSYGVRERRKQKMSSRSYNYQYLLYLMLFKY